MHWFWRATIAVAAACVYGGFSVTILHHVHQSVMIFMVESLVGSPSWEEWLRAVATSIAWFVPFMIFALAVFGPSAFRWWRDRHRRIPSGHCQKCGYNLTGNTSGVCPECGEKI